jgi:hypothetical protein
MMKASALILLIIYFLSCEQRPVDDSSTLNGSANDVILNGTMNSITITSNDYVLCLKGVKDTFKTVAQLQSNLENAGREIREDTMYIYMKSEIPDRMREVSPMLNSLAINKYQYIIDENYFALPYSNDSKKMKQQ